MNSRGSAALQAHRTRQQPPGCHYGDVLFSSARPPGGALYVWHDTIDPSQGSLARKPQWVAAPAWLHHCTISGFAQEEKKLPRTASATALFFSPSFLSATAHLVGLQHLVPTRRKNLVVLNPWFKCVRFCRKWIANSINSVFFFFFSLTSDIPLDRTSFLSWWNIAKPQAKSGRKYTVANAGTENKKHKCSSSTLLTKNRGKKWRLEVIVGSFQHHWNRFSNCLSSSRVQITPQLLTDFVLLSAWRSAGINPPFHVWYSSLESAAHFIWNAASYKHLGFFLFFKKCSIWTVKNAKTQVLSNLLWVPRLRRKVSGSDIYVMLFHKRCPGRKQYCMKTEGLKGTCLSFKICCSEVSVHGKIVVWVHRGIDLLQSAICGHQAKWEAELVGCDYILCCCCCRCSAWKSVVCFSVVNVGEIWRKHLELLSVKLWKAKRSTASEQQNKPTNFRGRLSVNSARDVDLGSTHCTEVQRSRSQQWKLLNIWKSFLSCCPAKTAPLSYATLKTSNTILFIL